MKSSLVRCIHLFLILAALQTTSQAAPQEKPDPLPGKWIWHHKITVVFHEDGTSTSDANSNGTWQFLHNAEVQRKYRVNWDHGKFVDNLILSEDGKTALLLTDSGHYNIRRAAD